MYVFLVKYSVELLAVESLDMLSVSMSRENHLESSQIHIREKFFLHPNHIFSRDVGDGMIGSPFCRG